LCHSRGGGNPDLYKSLICIGLDTRLRGYDKRSFVLYVPKTGFVNSLRPCRDSRGWIYLTLNSIIWVSTASATMV